MSSSAPSGSAAMPGEPEPSELLEWLSPDALFRPKNTLLRLVEAGLLTVLDPHVVKYNMMQQAGPQHAGGEAEVWLIDWRLPPCGTGGRAACPINEGDRVALKVRRLPTENGGFLEVSNEDDWRYEVGNNRKLLRNEVNVLKLLERHGFADRVPQVLGVVQHAGNMRDLPLFAYVMPDYRFGSMATLIRDTCERRTPEDVFAAFFGPRNATSEFSALMGTITRMNGEKGIMLQDISSNNLLIREEAGGGCRLLLADPSMCMRTCDLANPDMAQWIVSTWLWGSPTTRHKHYDPRADAYSLSFSFLELWLCAEGAPVPLYDLVEMTGADADIDKARTFSRALCVAMLKRHAVCPGAIVPRIRRELPVSWLQLWVLLLGTEDFASEEQLLSQQRHRRPAEADMVQASAELAGVAADVEALGGGGGGLSAASLATPEGEALVGRSLRLYEQLMALSQLGPSEGSPLLPLDPSLSWVAKHFMAQDHPLVAAMRAAQGPGATAPPALNQVPYRLRSFKHAVLEAQAVADCSPFAAAISRDKYASCLSSMYQAHEQRTTGVLAALLTPIPEDVLHAIRACTPAGPAPAPEAAELASNAAGQPASQLLHPAGLPPAHPPAAGHHSMPQWSAAAQPPSLAAPHAASMPALPIHAQHPAGRPALPPSSGGMASAGVPLPQAPAGLPTAGLSAQLAAPAAAALASPSVPASYSMLSINAAAAGAAARMDAARLLPQPAYAAPSSTHLPGPGAAAAAMPRSPAASPPPSFMQPLLVPAAAGGAGTPSTDLSAHTVAAGGPGDASPATSAGTSSPSKRKRGADQGAPPSMLAPGATLRFAVSRPGCVAGLPAFRLPPGTSGSNLYACMVAQLSERFRGDVHQLLLQRQGPYATLLGACGLQPARLDSLVAGSGSGHGYIEVSAASFLPGSSAADFTAAAPIVFHSRSRNNGDSEQQIECGGGSAEEQAQYSAALRAHLQQSLAEGVTLAYGRGAAATVLFRIALLHLPQGTAAMPWVSHEWQVPAADLATILTHAKHLFPKRK